MKKVSKSLMVGAGCLLTAITLTGCGPKEIPYEPQETPITDFHKTQEEDIGWDMETGWVQQDDSVVMSLSGAENCLPEVDKVSKEKNVVSVWLKETKTEGCGETEEEIGLAYTTINKTGDNVERVEVYEFGYTEPFEMQKLG